MPPLSGISPYYVSVFTTSLATDLRVNQGSLIVIFIVTFAVQLLRRGLAAFFCICVGQRFNKHRVLAAFIAYVILTSVLSLAATSIMGAMDYLPSNNGALTTVLRGQFLHTSFLVELIQDLVLGGLYFFGCTWLISKHLNLE